MFNSIKWLFKVIYLSDRGGDLNIYFIIVCGLVDMFIYKNLRVWGSFLIIGDLILRCFLINENYIILFVVYFNI